MRSVLALAVPEDAVPKVAALNGLAPGPVLEQARGNAFNIWDGPPAPLIGPPAPRPGGVGDGVADVAGVLLPPSELF